MSGLKKDLGTIQRAIQILAGTYDKDMLNFEVAQVKTVDTVNWLCSVQLVSSSVQATYNNVQLTAEKASNGFIQVPKINSNVILAITSRNEKYIFMCSEVDALVFHQLNSDGSTYEELVINCNSGYNPSLPLGITISDGGGNGVVINSGTGLPSVANGQNGIVITNSSSPPTNNTNNNGILISCSGTMQFNDGSYGGLVIGTGNNGLQAELNNLNAQLQALINIIKGTPVPEPGGGSASALQAALSNALTLVTTPSPDFSQIINTDITHGPLVS